MQCSHSNQEEEILNDFYDGTVILVPSKLHFLGSCLCHFCGLVALT